MELGALIDKVKQQELHAKKYTEQLRQESQERVRYVMGTLCITMCIEVIDVIINLKELVVFMLLHLL